MLVVDIKSYQERTDQEKENNTRKINTKLYKLIRFKDETSEAKHNLPESSPFLPA
jgi:hypothetical protein